MIEFLLKLSSAPAEHQIALVDLPTQDQPVILMAPDVRKNPHTTFSASSVISQPCHTLLDLLQMFLLNVKHRTYRPRSRA